MLNSDAVCLHSVGRRSSFRTTAASAAARCFQFAILYCFIVSLDYKLILFAVTHMTLIKRVLHWPNAGDSVKKLFIKSWNLSASGRHARVCWIVCLHICLPPSPRLFRSRQPHTPGHFSFRQIQTPANWPDKKLQLFRSAITLGT